LLVAHQVAPAELAGRPSRWPFSPGDSPLTARLPRPQPAARTQTRFACSARVRPGWLKVPSLPRGRRCPQRPLISRPPACRIATASPCHPGPRPAPERNCDEASARVHCHSPHTSLPLARDPGRNGSRRWRCTCTREKPSGTEGRPGPAAGARTGEGQAPSNGSPAGSKRAARARAADPCSVSFFLLRNQPDQG
jgi:hypothetical protein